MQADSLPAELPRKPSSLWKVLSDQAQVHTQRFASFKSWSGGSGNFLIDLDLTSVFWVPHWQVGGVVGGCGAKPPGTDGEWRPGWLSQATVWAMPTHTGLGRKLPSTQLTLQISVSGSNPVKYIVGSQDSVCFERLGKYPPNIPDFLSISKFFLSCIHEFSETFCCE